MSAEGFRYTEEKLNGLRASLVDDRRAEYATAELDIEAALELVDLALLGLKARNAALIR